MGKGRGKTFEGELLSAFRDKHPNAYVERNHDRMVWGKPELSLPSPPDLIVVKPDSLYLIEAKAKAGKSMPFSYSGGGTTLTDHQHDYLMKWDNMGKRYKGFIAVNLYNNKKGRFNRAWLVPIKYWSQYQQRYPRKSIAMKHLEDDLPYNELIRIPGSKWQLPEWA
jgi:hypothetical protein